MRGKRALFGAKDLGSAGVILPLAKVWREAGGESVVIVEGLAGPKFLEAGFVPFFQGTENFQTVPFTLDVATALKIILPDVVILCGSEPINLERLMAKEAAAAGISLVAVDDLWGGYKRLEAKPSLVLTSDALGQKMAAGHSSVIVGNPGIPSEEKIVALRKESATVRSLVSRGDEKIIAYVSGDRSSTEEEIALLLKCLDRTPEPWKLLVAFHPKWLKDYGTRWRGILAQVPEVVYACDIRLTSEQAVSVADVVVGGVSTAMTTAAVLRKQVVSLATPEVMRILRKTANLKEVPQVSLGLAHKVTRPTSFAEMGSPNEKTLVELSSYDPVKGYWAIHALLD